MQIIVNILLQSALLLLVGLSFSIIYHSTKFFNISLAAIITYAAYFTYVFFVLINVSSILGVSLAIVSCISISLIFELYIFRYMREKDFSPFALLIVSLGIYVILQNLLSMIFGVDTKSIRLGEVKVGNEIFGAYITNIQVTTIITSVSLFILVLILISKTSLGRQIRAVSNNQELCEVYGVNSNRIILYVTIISTGLAATAGILIALDVNMTPNFGFNYLLYGVIAMIIGGIGSYRGLILGSLLLATAQHLAAYYIDTKWMDAVAYIILILFLIWKPLGFSGVRLRKVEI